MSIPNNANVDLNKTAFCNLGRLVRDVFSGGRRSSPKQCSQLLAADKLCEGRE